MDAGTREAKIRELDAEILAILEECKAQGRTKEDISFIFAPLGLKSTIQVQGGMTPDIDQNAGRQRGISFTCPSKTSLKKIVVIMGCIMMAGLVYTANDTSVVGLKFHALAIMRIALMKVRNFEMYMTNVCVSWVRDFNSIWLIKQSITYLFKVLPYWNWTDMYYTRCLVRNPFYEAADLNLDDCYVRLQFTYSLITNHTCTN
jgi:hypothetical protein